MKKHLVILLFIYSIISIPLSAHPDLIESYKIINKNKIVVKANKSFFKQLIKEDFFAEYDKNVDLTQLDESLVMIPFILNIAPIIWFFNKKYSIEVMDKDLYYALQKIRGVLRLFYPQHKWEGDLIPQQLVTNNVNKTFASSKVALLFSGGLDSVEGSLRYVDVKQLLITIWGNDIKVKADKKWQTVCK